LLLADRSGAGASPLAARSIGEKRLSEERVPARGTDRAAWRANGSPDAK